MSEECSFGLCSLCSTGRSSSRKWVLSLNLSHRPKSITFPGASSVVVRHKDFLPYADLDTPLAINTANIMANSNRQLLLLLLSPF